MNRNQLKGEVHDTYKKDEKITTNFEPTDISDVNNKAYPDENVSEKDDHLSLLEKNYKEVKLHYNKKSVDESFNSEGSQTDQLNTV